jgi:hypothetical protein
MAWTPELNHAVEKLGTAVRLLAVSPGDVRSRLKHAGREILILKADDFPGELRRDYEWIRHQLTRYEAKAGEGTLIATMERIKNTTGSKIAERIVELHSAAEARLADKEV